MCGAFGISRPEDILERFDSDPFNQRWEGSYNIRPAQPAPVVVRNSPNSTHLATFGFVPAWNKEARPKFAPINAKSETVASNGYFKSAFASSRCIVPAQFYFEWKKFEMDGKTDKQPYLFKVKDEDIFGLAGIYSLRKDAEGHEHYSFAILTTKPNKLAATVHHRMPVILHKEDEEVWLDKESTAKDLMHCLRSYEADKMQTFRVSKEVSSSRNDGPDLIKPIKDNEK